MIKGFHFFVIAMLIGMTLSGCASIFSDSNKSISFNEERAFADVENQLAFGPRTPESEGHAKFITWLESELKKSGWQTTIQQGEMMGHPIKNIVARRGDETPKILLIAHYDSRLLADNDPDPGKHSSPVAGANDGASGVAVLLELSRILPRDSVPIGFVFLDAEDNGHIPSWDWILGSRYFVSEMVFRPQAVILVDMIGDADLHIYKEINSDPGLTSQIWDVAKKLGYEKYFIDEIKHQILDDHVPFIEAGIPALDIIDIEYAYWHTTLDTTDKVSPRSLGVVGDTLLQWILLQKNSGSMDGK
jgi:glutaminyl-peptide cyclotransferase